jgi:hypothetical protein
VSDAADLSGDLGPARDQGNRGTCLAFAATAAHEQARRRRRRDAFALGEEILYWACKQVDGDGASGTRPGSAAQALSGTGQSAAGLWPYDGERDDTAADYAPPAAALEPGEMRRASLLPTARDITNFRDLLRGGHAIVLGLELWAQFYEAHGGALPVPASADLLGEGHAVALVGFDDGAQELLLRNSWGETWGDGGHGRLPYRALAVVGLRAFIVEDDIDA